MVNKVRAYRMSYQANFSIKYSGWIKLMALTFSCLIAAGLTSFFLRNVSITQILIMFPLTWIISNFIEYSLHRWPMHRLIRGLKSIYKNHSGQHHRYFTHEFMSIETPYDMHEVFTKYKILVILVFAVIFPISLLFGIFSINIGLLFFSFALLYYVLYEWTHFATHISNSYWITKIPYIRGAKKRHTIHHNTRLMKDWNFNVSFPLFDLIFRTYKK